MKIRSLIKYCDCKASIASETPKELQRLPVLGEWLRRDIQHCRFKDYDLTFAFYTKFPSWGCPSKPTCSSAYILKPFPSNFPHSKQTFPFQTIKSYNLVNTPLSYPNLKTKVFKVMFNCQEKSFTSFHCSKLKIKEFEDMLNCQKLCLTDQILRFYPENNSNCLKTKITCSNLQSVCALITFLKTKPHKFTQNFIKFTYQRIFILNCHMYLILIVFLHAVLMLSSWWRDKISWDKCVDFYSR